MSLEGVGFGVTNFSDTAPVDTGTATAGTLATAARGDHVHAVGNGTILPAKLAAGAEGEGHITINPALGVTVVAGTWALGIGATFINCMYFGNGATKALNDEIDFMVYLAVGTYRIDVYGLVSSDYGIATIKFNSTSVATLDFYAAGAASNVLKTATGISVTTAGLYTVKIVAATKNGSSTAYQLNLSAINISRSA